MPSTSCHRHIFFIDGPEQLTVKKDTSLMLALSLRQMGREVSLLFEQDFFHTNQLKAKLSVHDFSLSWQDGGPYMGDFRLGQKREIEPSPGDTIHLRLDPPFDGRYLRILWMLKALSDMTKVSVINSPTGVLLHNEKLAALACERALASFVGISVSGLLEFAERQKRQGAKALIFKPMDAYQGMGVEKVSLAASEAQLTRAFRGKVAALGGPVLVQPFDERVLEGEVRALYCKGEEIGSILKTPPEGEFLATIARGATFAKAHLNRRQRESCRGLSLELAEHGADFVAFDLLGDSIQEANITCPGLLVEASAAAGANLACKVIELMR